MRRGRIPALRGYRKRMMIARMAAIAVGTMQAEIHRGLGEGRGRGNSGHGAAYMTRMSISKAGYPQITAGSHIQIPSKTKRKSSRTSPTCGPPLLLYGHLLAHLHYRSQALVTEMAKAISCGDPSLKSRQSQTGYCPSLLQAE